MKNVSRRIAGFAVVLGLLVIGVAPASASHSWNGYHWSRSSNPFTVPCNDNLSANWSSYLATAVTQWSLTSGSCNNPSNPARLSVGPGHSNRNCRSTNGNVEVCNASYGNTGWLGIASISVSGGHITKGSVKVNDTYFNQAQYNTPAWRQFVMSQEVGHTLGLTHQDETFGNADLLDACGRGSCMDYSSDPTNNTTPNQHDYDELVAIYSHLDGGPVANAAVPAEEGVDVDNPSSWGQAVRFANGRGIVYEREFGPGNKVVTFVIWAE